MIYFILLIYHGYGYSKMSKSEQEKVGNFTEQYLIKRKNICLIIFLIDIRHDPSSNDKLMYDFIIKNNLPCIVLCNKADKIAITKVNDRIIEMQNLLNPLNDILFLPFSSERKIYSDNVWNEIQKYL